MILTENILRSLRSARWGMSSNELFAATGSDDIECLRVMISMAVQRGLVRTDGKKSCHECKKEAKCYRITEKGRLYLERRS